LVPSVLGFTKIQQNILSEPVGLYFKKILFLIKQGYPDLFFFKLMDV